MVQHSEHECHSDEDGGPSRSPQAASFRQCRYRYHTLQSYLDQGDARIGRQDNDKTVMCPEAGDLSTSKVRPSGPLSVGVRYSA